jgi:NAD(P)-dependent dehydrogenase (short-subunit alcohol dehydrogenase family)
MGESQQVAVITGAGSGVGRAVAVKLSGAGYRLAIVGRREDALAETRSLCARPGDVLVVPCDVADPKAVEEMAGRAVAHFGQVDALVNSAGTNMPKRLLPEVSVEDYRAVVDVNLNGTFYCCRALLPQMRSRGGGTIVNVISDAGIWANPVSGAAYVASKFGAVGLTATINAEERKNGIRACGILPGEIDTPLLKKRPTMPSEEQRKRMLQPEDVAECVAFALSLPDRVVVEQLLVRPR